jgi:hypothetical protein
VDRAAYPGIDRCRSSASCPSYYFCAWDFKTVFAAFSAARKKRIDFIGAALQGWVLVRYNLRV